jgi:hypothetical protein
MTTRLHNPLIWLALAFLLLFAVETLLRAQDFTIDTSDCSPDGTGNVYVTPGVPFSCTLKVVNSTLPPGFTWKITNGALPNGFTLDPNTGVLSGTWPVGPPTGLKAVPVRNRKKKRERVLLIKLTK